MAPTNATQGRPVPPTADPGRTATDEAGEPEEDHGRIGYGRLARFTPYGLAALLVVGLAAIGLARGEPTAAPDPGGIVGKPAPDVTLRVLDGSTLRLADLRGSVVLVNFWASWCEPCREEMPVLQRYGERTARTGERTVVVGVGVRTDFDDEARALVRDLGLTYPIGRDTDVAGPGIGPIQRAFAITDLLPATVVVRPDGVVDRLHLGPLTDDQIGDLVAEARRPNG